MSRKDFIAISKIINNEPSEDVNNITAFDCKKGIAYGLCEYFKESNINFDRSRFLTACGIETEL